MDIIIRSQCGNIFKVDNIKTHDFETRNITSEINGKTVFLGDYEDTARAIKILDEISDIVENACREKGYIENEYGDKRELSLPPTAIFFRMPKE